jgi:hypothetical protein
VVGCAASSVGSAVGPQAVTMRLTTTSSANKLNRYFFIFSLLQIWIHIFVTELDLEKA